MFKTKVRVAIITKKQYNFRPTKFHDIEKKTINCNQEGVLFISS